ncbi:hypothetical protein PV327_010182 [Microctonus hyperodae]|uniref:Uncharacterized protein n=1 Tax=Microctonus hyperodae TaxID=165561 RepID=A0AA39KUI8_MICHY|nr:hypothetical protein PV327_010182 [Microctonus hyperodae]
MDGERRLQGRKKEGYGGGREGSAAMQDYTERGEKDEVHCGEKDTKGAEGKNSDEDVERILQEVARRDVGEAGVDWNLDIEKMQRVVQGLNDRKLLVKRSYEQSVEIRRGKSSEVVMRDR